MWTQEAIAIGFPNRLFLVSADRKRKVAWPQQPDQAELDALRSRISKQIGRLPLTLDITKEAKTAWEHWYENLPASEHAKRLDTIGFRLLPLIALITDKNSIDLETVEVVVSILDYELNIRRLFDPIDADNLVAKVEEKIRRVLKDRGSLRRRDLRRAVHADRDGLWAFTAALANLHKEGVIKPDGGIFTFEG